MLAVGEQISLWTVDLKRLSNALIQYVVHLTWCKAWSIVCRRQRARHKLNMHAGSAGCIAAAREDGVLFFTLFS